MKFYITLVFLLAHFLTRAQVTFKLEIKDANTVIITALDKTGAYVKGTDGKNIDPATVAFSEAGGKIQIKNATGAPIRFRLVANNDEGKKIVTPELALNVDETLDFSFDNKGMLTKGDKILDSAKEVTISNLRLEITQPFQKTIGEELSVLTGKKIPAKESQTDDCGECAVYGDESERGVIHYDFECKCFYRLEGTTRKIVNLARLKLRHNDALQFRIDKVNRYYYDVGVESHEISYESEMPALLRQLFIGDTAKLLGNLLSAFTKSVTEKQSSDTAEFRKKFDAFKTALKKFQDRYAELQSKKLEAYYACTKFNCCSHDNIGFSYSKLLEALSDIRLTLYDLQVAVKTDPYVVKLKKDLAANRTQIAACKEQDKKISEAQKKMEAEGNETKKAALKKTLEAEEAKRCKDASAIESTIAAVEDELKLYNNIDKMQASLPDEQELARLYLFVNNMRSQHNSFITPPIYASGNRLELVFKIMPRDTSLISKWDIMPLYRDSVYYDIPVLRKPFISFSSGSFIAPKKYLQNTSYAWQAIPDNNVVGDSTNYVLTPTGYSPQPVGFAAFLHAELKILPSIGIGPSLGVGLTIETTPRLVYLAGGSVFFGDLKQLALSGGAAVMHINRLNNNWMTIAEQQIQYTKKPEIEFYKESKIGWFVAVSYTPFNVNKRSVNKSGKKN